MATTWQAIPKPGGTGVAYDDSDTGYDQLSETNSGLPLLYDSAGLVTIWTAINKP